MSKVSEWKGSVGEGWWPLLDDLDAELLELNPAYETVQVKEKFGTLRVYLQSESMTGDWDDYRIIVRRYELASSFICEDCGRYGKIRTDGWALTLCDGCAVRRGRAVEQKTAKPVSARIRNALKEAVTGEDLDRDYRDIQP